MIKQMKHPTKISRRMARLNRMGYVFILPFFLFFIVFNLYPILYSLVLSFFEWNGMGKKNYAGLANYSRVFFSDPYFFQSLGNTFLVMVVYLPISLIAALLIATLLYNKHIKHASFFQTAQFLPYIVAPVAVGMLFQILFDWSTGTVNQLLMAAGFIKEGLNWLGDPGLARGVLILLMIWKELGYAVTLFLAAMTNISPDLIEASEVDGANYIQRLMRIIIPQLNPIILFITITGSISCLQMFDAPKILVGAIGEGRTIIGGPGRSCLTPIWYMIDTAFGQTTGAPAFGYGAAISYGLFLVIALFSIINYKIIKRSENT
ncbi:MAG: sugar ABC transporter permease [Treponema sp.]|jgi:multiple sugar transport system permease protein/cellobiose transport system permease protein|nr:sugar ABC transporter permease [Treponema sp.]